MMFPEVVTCETSIITMIFTATVNITVTNSTKLQADSLLLFVYTFIP